MLVRNATFVKFAGAGNLGAGGSGGCGKQLPRAGVSGEGGWEMRFSGTTWVRSGSRVAFSGLKTPCGCSCAAAEESGMILVDLDGSFSGRVGHSVVPKNSLLESKGIFPDCIEDGAYGVSAEGAAKGMICPLAFARVVVAKVGELPYGSAKSLIKLVVSWHGVDVPQQHPSSHDFDTVTRPTAADPPGTNMFVAWENKLYFVVCGTRGSTAGGLTIRTLPVIMLAIRVNEEVGVDEFFDPNTLVRNIVALFGIPPNRVRIASVVPDSGRRRRLAGRGLGGRALEESFFGSEVKLQIEQADPCDELTCGHGDCARGPDGSAACACHDGWTTPAGCGGGDCTCSAQTCHEDCLFCDGPLAANCTTCASDKPFRKEGRCLDSCGVGWFSMAPAANTTDGTCQRCPSACVSCDVSGSCTACPLTRPNRVPDAALNGSRLTCVSSCPAATYAGSEGLCEDCHASCLECTGPGSSMCIACASHPCKSSPRGCPAGITPLLDPAADASEAGAGSCVSACPAGKFRNGTECASCDRRCSVCTHR
ncbi:hypothetical protein EMIHUDRAFT_216276 [Emiliania huxleyi CCMP1516]|uniref:EGF-like domain-containing protein n=2 Tax=Emiliania huxleyi TaxID=2903 RepID=A0A0D3IFQ5_EMIH1|nr:hypothetical protein EMIHUDRAFT_216276 [Emiliania huxleyi CCMP1516]EOD10090.1 hypothetical protein EMIHUDRAFT_216276 [Emiliania huxleyi CCMP1516]|eukprot:XP_005762519.1 hypothetical protein EMIHUDRAFT_216276 [Emiliania huxleyi CCMP1516]